MNTEHRGTKKKRLIKLQAYISGGIVIWKGGIRNNL